MVTDVNDQEGVGLVRKVVGTSVDELYAIFRRAPNKKMMELDPIRVHVAVRLMNKFSRKTEVNDAICAFVMNLVPKNTSGWYDISDLFPITVRAKEYATGFWEDMRKYA
ncbi:MAG: hypothetical protein AABX29_01310 [Nanoarchaeota archaeon]